jgi:phenylalanyl-tRNA synthetase beta chain
MKASLNWLRRLVDLPETPAEIAAVLTAAGLEVEGIEEVFTLDGVVVGEVRSAEKVEGTHLSQCVVFDGHQELPIVCGAANVRAGLKVALATVGTVLPDMEIKAAKVKGMESLGMLCAEDELGLGEGHAGILELDPSLVPGQSFSQAVGIADTVFEINVTPNRPDATGHLGLARELAASLGRPLRNPLEDASPAASGMPSIAVVVEPGAGCTRYVARTISSLSNGPSPAWMQNLLRAIGLRPISALVDITNFILMDVGQPLHAFDAAKLQGSLAVRKALTGETLQTLDGVAHALQAGDLVISDSVAPQCLGGVMGGEQSGVSESTTEILLETAYFQPSVVRKLAKRHGLGSDSSYRFERGVDPFATAKVSAYATRLILEICGGSASEAFDHIAPEHLTASVVVEFSSAAVQKRLGLELPESRLCEILEGLGFVRQPGDSLAFAVPGWRPDVRESCDLTEEIARCIGYDNIVPQDAVYPVTAVKLPARERWLRRIRRILAARGLQETLSIRFQGRKDHTRMGYGPSDSRSQLVELANPLSDDWAALPRLGVVNLLRAAVRNEKRQEKSVRLFECVRVFGQDFPEEFGRHRKIGIGERNVLSGLLSGSMPHQSWSDDTGFDFYRAKGILQGLLTELGLSSTFVQGVNEPWLHPGRSARVLVAGQEVGVFGQLHPVAQEEWELKLEPFVWELDLDALVGILEGRSAIQVTAPSEYSATRREVNVLTDEKRAAQALLETVQAYALDNSSDLREIQLVSVYQGDGIPTGMKSLLLRFWYQSAVRTLTDAEVNEVHNQLRQAISDMDGISLK